MAESLVGMIGKSFLYEEREKVKRLTETITGTIAAFVGGANWGPVNVPTMVVKDFTGIFGDPLTKGDVTDFSGQAALYTLGYAPFCWFTRVSNGSDSQAIYNVVKAATPAVISGTVNLQDSDFVIYAADETDTYDDDLAQNNLLELTVDVNGTVTPVHVILAATSACLAVQSNETFPVVATDDTIIQGNGNYLPGATIIFSIDGIDYRYVVKDEFSTIGTRLPDTPDFMNLVVPATGVYGASYTTPAALWSEYTPGAAVSTYAERFAYAIKKFVIEPKLALVYPGVLEATRIAIAARLATVSADALSVKLVSILRGASSEIKVYEMPKIFGASSTNPTISSGTDTSIDSIITQINAAITLTAASGKAVVSLDAQYYTFQFLSSTAGLTYGIRILATSPTDANIYTALGIAITSMTYGTDAIADAGTFKAIYTGKAGDSIVLSKDKETDGYSLSIFFQGYSVAKFFNYSYTVADTNFIGTLIAKDPYASKILTLELISGATSMPALAYGSITLGGGTSGLPINETKYNAALEAYKNVDLYSIDIICVSGVTSTSVQDKMQDVCEYRRDCFAVIDAPESVAGPAGSSVDMIDWHNGLGGGRTKKLDSKFVSTYFPWISIPDGTVDAETNFYAPSVRVVGTIASTDKLKGHKFAAPAGNVNAALTSVNHLAHYLREDEKQRMYADELDNNINPIVYTTSRGFFIDGQKDCQRGAGAITRLNVLRTSLYIKKRIYELTPNFFWKPLTQGTMDDLAFALRSIGTYLSSNEVLAMKPDFVVTVDQTINTEITEAQRGLIGIIEWTPVRSIEKIKIISVIRDLQVTVTYA